MKFPSSRKAPFYPIASPFWVMHRFPRFLSKGSCYLRDILAKERVDSAVHESPRTFKTLPTVLVPNYASKFNKISPLQLFVYHFRVQHNRRTNWCLKNGFWFKLLSFSTKTCFFLFFPTNQSKFKTVLSFPGFIFANRALEKIPAITGRQKYGKKTFYTAIFGTRE